MVFLLNGIDLLGNECANRLHDGGKGSQEISPRDVSQSVMHWIYQKTSYRLSSRIFRRFSRPNLLSASSARKSQFSGKLTSQVRSWFWNCCLMACSQLSFINFFCSAEVTSVHEPSGILFLTAFKNSSSRKTPPQRSPRQRLASCVMIILEGEGHRSLTCRPLRHTPSR